MTPRLRIVLCHDCCAPLCEDDRLHYVYQCHDCVVLELDLSSLARRDPDHPEVSRLEASAVDLDSPRKTRPQIDSVRRVA